MKKIFAVCFVLFTGVVFAQNHSTIPLDDAVYDVIESAEAKGYCAFLYDVKPYSQSYVISVLDEIIDNLENTESEDNSLIAKELEIVKAQKKRFEKQPGFNWKNLEFLYQKDIGNVPFSLDIRNQLDGLFSGALYEPKEFSSWGYEFYDTLDIEGDLSNYFSYRFEVFVGLTYMPLFYKGKYTIGDWWYDFTGGVKPNDVDYNFNRAINTFRNYSVLPYTYKKFWDGNIWYLDAMNASGLEGWATQNAISFGMNGEVRSSFLDNRVEIGMGRNDHEWAAMDDGSSLVINNMAHPFLAADIAFRPFKWIAFSALTGALEFPNQGYITEQAYRRPDSYEWYRDSYLYQNAFSIAMLDLDFKYFHFDFGSACVWPKRFELGYAFPFIDNVIVQDTIGDYDNLCLFGDLMFRQPGIWKAWISGYLDEMPKPDPRLMFMKQRYMFALQGGAEVVLPFLPFTTLSFRYTKVEPYCYTHHAVKNTPWYNDYLCEPYTNNGECIGYYLPPNSDEFHIRLESKPLVNLSAILQYQLIRHGADYGSRQVPGSSLYSELQKENRDDLNKYFLKDGCYEWSNIVTLSGIYDFGHMGCPVKLNFTLGYVYDFFTDTNAAIGTEGNFSVIDNAEYPSSSGIVASIGFTIFAR